MSGSPERAHLGGAVENVHADTLIYRRKIERARRTAEEFSWTRVTANYFALYDRFHAWSLQEGFHDEPATPASVSGAGASEVCSFGAS